MNVICINNVNFENDLNLNQIYTIKIVSNNFYKIYINSKKRCIFVSQNRFLTIPKYRKLKINKLYDNN